MEFDIIRRYFLDQPVKRADVIVPSGDDCAVTRVPQGYDLVSTIDVMNEDIHFPKSTNPHAIGYKLLAVSVSDCAAMGATPAWVTATISIPSVDERWIAAFSTGFFDCAKRYQVQLIGGDLTRGPLSLTSHVQGLVPQGKAITQSGAQVGDIVYVTGNLGDAALALAAIQNRVLLEASQLKSLQKALDYPEPPATFAIQLIDIATSCADISDGLVAELKQINQASNVGIEIYAADLPLSAILQTLPLETALRYALYGGDDYQLCFTANKKHNAKLKQIAQAAGIRLSKVGQVVPEKTFTLIDKSGNAMKPLLGGYQHFSVHQDK